MTGAAKKVLIVDDEPDVREFIKEVLEEDGYIFLEAEDGETAVQIAGAASPDVVIMDVQMPKKDGFQAFYELRNNDATKSIPVIMLTAVAERTGIKFDAKDMGEYLGSEPEAYIDKPIDPGKLPAAVKSVIERASAG
jgi:CheY-like chemotaxis protein